VITYEYAKEPVLNFNDGWDIVSLKGGYGTISGVILGAALVQVIQKATFFVGVPDKFDFVVVGSIILIGVILDEVMSKYIKKKV